ncbi:thermostable hemolysin, partial [Salinivibrio sp. PR919]|uniref:thermostable hemolysin n=1 Tax=Salinivibrio sp. PR919 TaxID=1909491 RepID=UPI0009C792BD
MRVLFERLADYARSQPDQVAIHGSDASGDCLILTYQALWGRIRALSETLLALDTQMIGLAGDNSVSWVLIDLAAAYAGISIVPIPPFFTAEQQQHVLDTAGVDWVIGSPHPDVSLSHASVTTLAGLPCHARDVDAPLYALMRRFGLEPHLLTDAEASRLQPATDQWGNYYTRMPR